MSNACRIRSVVMPVKRRSTGSRRSRVMRNLHTKRRKHSRRKHSRRKHSRGRGRKHSRKRHSRRRRSRGRGRKHSRKHRRKHYVHHHKNLRNLGRAPKIDGYVLRDIVIGNKRPNQDILNHMPEMHRLHELLKKFQRGSDHGYNLDKRKEIYSKLVPKIEHTDEQTDSLQKKAMTSIIKDLEAMGLKTPSTQAKLGEREEHKLYNVQTDEMMGL